MTAPAVSGTDAAELPLIARPDDPDWTENYCNQAYCPDSQVGFWTHLSRLAHPHQVWRDVLIVYLPGDRFLVAKGFGRPTIGDGPAAGMLSLTCEESWKTWTMRFSGGVRDVSGDELRAGALSDGHYVSATLELRWEAMSPVWQLGSRMDEQTWAHSHYEQACQVSGQLAVGAESWDLAGSGIRDHSRGPRDFATVREHWWLSAQFPSGRSFALLDVTNHGSDVTPLRHAYVSDGSTIEEAEVIAVEVLEATRNGSPVRTRVRLRTSQGEQLIEGRILQSMPFAMGSPNELIFGAAHGDRDPLALSECQTEYRWGDELSYGLTERSRTPA
jgi:hypothetical protein